MNNIVESKLSFKSNSIWNLTGSLFYSLSQWGLLVIIANFTGAENVGIFTYALAITAPLVLFYRFNLRVVLASDVNSDFDFSDYYSVRIYSNLVFSITLLLLVFLLVKDVYIIVIIILLGVAKNVESISDIYYGQFQKEERLDKVAKSKILKSFISLLLFGVIMYFTSSLFWGVVSLIISWGVVTFLYDHKLLLKKLNINLKKLNKPLFSLFLLALPLGIAQLFISLNANLPRYFLEHYIGLEALGIYGGLIYIIVSGNQFILAFTAVLIPKLSKLYFANQYLRFVNIVVTCTIIIFIIGLSGLLCIYHFGENILSFVYSVEFSDYNYEFLWIFATGIVMYIGKLIEAALSSIRKFHIQAYMSILTFVLIFILSIFLIPNLGLFGAVVALLISESFQLIIRVLYLIKALSE